MTTFGFHPVEKPKHNRRVPKRVDRGKFSAKTIKEIFERDGHQCIRCGTKKNLERTPHHVIYKSAGGLGTKRNGVTTCLDCHREAHALKEVRKWFERYVEKHFDEDGNRL